MTYYDRSSGINWGLVGRWAGGLAFTLFFFPFLVAYALPIFLVSVLLAWLFDLACHDNESVRNYSMLGWFAPPVLVFIFLILTALAPAQVTTPAPVNQVASSRVLAPRLATLKSKGRKASAVKDRHEEKEDVEAGIQNAVASPEVYDGFNEAFNWFYHAWYDGFPLIKYAVDPKARVSFNYWHFFWIMMSALGIGLPVAFRRSRDEVAHDVRAAAAKKARTVEIRYDDLREEFRKAKDDFASKQGRFRRALEERDDEIVVLKQREKYLTDGKPKPITTTPEKPDLNYL